MTSKLKKIIANLALLTGSLLACLLVFELVVFKYFFVPDDVLPNVTIDGIVRYQPNTKAVFRHPDKSSSTVCINEEGWNSTHLQYAFEKPKDVLRVAIVGDSYVHGAFVDVEKGFPNQLQSLMRKSGLKAEVYQFGMDGAPLSQYLHMLRRTVVDYKPDVVVIPLIHNDFDETYRMIGTRYNSSFLKINRDEAGRVVEIPPRTFQPGFADLLRSFRTFRYLYYETGAYLKLKKHVSKIFWGGSAEHKPEFISSAIDVRNIRNEEANIRFFTRYVMNEIKLLSKKHDFKTLFIMDGVREAIYEGRNIDSYDVAKLNHIAADIARELELPFIDLHDKFAMHFTDNRKRFEFPFDWHWNELANRLVADVIWNEMQANDNELLASGKRDRQVTHARHDHSSAEPVENMTDLN